MVNPDLSPDLLAPADVKQVRLDFTSRCNLRCVYCAVSQKRYVGIDMNRDLLARAVAMIRDLARFHDLAPIDVNGHGETTIVDGWEDACLSLLESGLTLRLTSNFAKEFSHAELDVLARMKSIAVSIDTCDRELLRRMRRKVDVRQIVHNIIRVRASAARQRHPAPEFHFLSGLYDKNSLLLEDFAHFASALQIRHVGFWSLTPFPYDQTDVPEEDRALPLDDLPDEALIPRVQAIRRGLQLLQRKKVSVNVQADFINVLAVKRGIPEQRQA